METNTTLQEILLMTNTTFSSRQWYDKDDLAKSRQMSEKERLEEACWNGLLSEMLPEISEPSETLHIWQVKEGASFLDVELSEFPAEKDNHFSIDPYCFLRVQSAN
jgi:hypothetical protein